MVMGQMMPTILMFQMERPVFLREHTSRMYSISAYYISKVIVDMPLVLICNTLNAIIVYFGIGLTITAG